LEKSITVRDIFLLEGFFLPFLRSCEGDLPRIFGLRIFLSAIMEELEIFGLLLLPTLGLLVVELLTLAVVVCIILEVLVGSEFMLLGMLLS